MRGQALGAEGVNRKAGVEGLNTRKAGKRREFRLHIHLRSPGPVFWLVLSADKKHTRSMFFGSQAFVDLFCLCAALGLHAGKRLQADWKRVLGENAIDIRSGFLSQGTSREGGSLSMQGWVIKNAGVHEPLP
eukprot:1158705-Pelagomonas_calceolata.AAC.27